MLVFFTKESIKYIGPSKQSTNQSGSNKLLNDVSNFQIEINKTE